MVGPSVPSVLVSDRQLCLPGLLCWVEALLSTLSPSRQSAPSPSAIMSEKHPFYCFGKPERQAGMGLQRTQYCPASRSDFPPLPRDFLWELGRPPEAQVILSPWKGSGGPAPPTRCWLMTSPAFQHSAAKWDPDVT